MVKRIRLFRPLLAGANARDRAITCLAIAAGVAIVSLAGTVIDDPIRSDSWIFVPVGASAILIFAVPSSPLTQPWQVIGGLVISSSAGLLTGTLIGHEALAIGAAVGVAVGAMSLARALHPPGGAAAIIAALNVPDSFAWDALLPLLLVGFDAFGIVLLGWAFHRLVTGHSYPHVAPVVAEDEETDPSHSSLAVRFGPQDVDSVLARIDDTFDISRADLEAILRAVEAEALHRELVDMETGDPASRI